MKLLLSLVAIVGGFIVCGLMLVATPAMAAEVTFSDTLSFTWGGVTIAKNIAEVPGEKVGEEIDFSFPTPALGFGSKEVNSDFVYLLEPGTTAINSDGTVTGNRSDQIQLKVSFEKGNTNVTVTLNSDEDPGTHDPVTGLLETGLPQDITALLFAGLDTGDFHPQVLVTSDGEGTAVPEPATLLLLGSGLVGLVGYRRMKRMM